MSQGGHLNAERAHHVLQQLRAKLSTHHHAAQKDEALHQAVERLAALINSPLHRALIEIRECYESDVTEALAAAALTANQNDATENDSPPLSRKISINKQSAKEKDSSQLNQQQENARGDAAQEENEEGDGETMISGEWVFVDIDLRRRGGHGYGFSIAGGVDFPHYEGDSAIYVTDIVSGATAQLDGRLRLDDVILEVNGQSLEAVTHQTAVNTLKNCGARMQLSVRRFQTYSPHTEQAEHEQQRQQPQNEEVEEEEDAYHYFEVSLTKRPGVPLGLSIEGGAEENGSSGEGGEGGTADFVTVSRVAAGGLADESGQIAVGDILVQVNSQSTFQLSHDQVAQIVRNAPREVHLVMARLKSDSSGLLAATQ